MVAGPEKKSHIVTERDKKITAYKEEENEIAEYKLETKDKVHQVRVIPRGMAAGLTWTRPDNDDSHVTRRKMQEMIVMTLGGRAAEAIVMEDVCTGASSDLERASKLARDMVTRYGFSDKLGLVVYGSDQDEVFLGRDYGHTVSYSESISAQIDAEVHDIVNRAYQQCENILKDHYSQLTMLAEYLLEYEKIDGEDFDRLMKGEPISHPEPKTTGTESDTASNATDEAPTDQTEE